MPATLSLADSRFGRLARERYAMNHFLERLAALNTREEAAAFLADRPATSAAANPLYDRLIAFLTALEPPAGAWQVEIAAYAALVRRMVNSGSLPYRDAARALAAIARASDLMYTAPEDGDD